MSSAAVMPKHADDSRCGVLVVTGERHRRMDSQGQRAEFGERSQDRDAVGTGRVGDERARLDGLGGRETSHKIRKLVVRNGKNQQFGASCDVGSRKNFGIGKPLHSAGDRGTGDGGASD